MSQEIFNWVWFVLLIVIITVRKVHERKAGQHSSLKETPLLEAILMMLWGIAACVLPAIFIFSSWFDFADFPGGVQPVAGYTGSVLFLISIWLLHRSHTDLGVLWSPSVEPDSEHRLVTGGVYKLVRHPMYAVHVVWGIAQIMLIPNLIAGPLALILILLVISMRIPREEQSMIEQFGEEYRQYMNKTSRIIPRSSK
ncbi:protein-S-isoprenylcysteine O-methyltransferase [Gemmatimonadota bacterium]